MIGDGVLLFVLKSIIEGLGEDEIEIVEEIVGDILIVFVQLLLGKIELDNDIETEIVFVDVIDKDFEFDLVLVIENEILCDELGLIV